jgi:hypothetical protein
MIDTTDTAVTFDEIFTYLTEYNKKGAGKTAPFAFVMIRIVAIEICKK